MRVPFGATAPEEHHVSVRIISGRKEFVTTSYSAECVVQSTFKTRSIGSCRQMPPGGRDWNDQSQYDKKQPRDQYEVTACALPILQWFFEAAPPAIKDAIRAAIRDVIRAGEAKNEQH
uniref:Uncharacterized protein n=1 Tax=Ananas comosus var. bracteatus TaxID=296719 RepID=A0A6V7PL56_ANACO|nr:unnamed protein product [Ananas comosus var. bracteatus]